MIEQPPKFTGTVDLDGEETPGETHEDAAPHVGGTAGDASAADFADEFDRDHDFPGSEEGDAEDLEALAAKRKRNANLITYGGGAFFFLAILVAGYFQFAPLFKGGAAHPQHAAVPVPTAAPHSYTVSNTGTDTGTVNPQSNTLAPPPAPATVANAPVPLPMPASAPAASSLVAPQTQTAPTGAPAQPASSNTPAPMMPPMQTMQGNMAGNTATNADMSTLSAKVDALAGKVTALQGAVSTLTAQQNASPQLQQIQNALEALQRQVSEISPKTETQSLPIRKTPHVIKRKRRTLSVASDSAADSAPIQPYIRHEAPALLESGQGGGWILRAATPGSAMISKPGSNDLQHVTVGDTISGLGRIMSITDAGGRWIVKGTNGSIGQ